MLPWDSPNKLILEILPLRNCQSRQNHLYLLCWFTQLSKLQWHYMERHLIHPEDPGHTIVHPMNPELPQLDLLTEIMNPVVMGPDIPMQFIRLDMQPHQEPLDLHQPVEEILLTLSMRDQHLGDKVHQLQGLRTSDQSTGMHIQLSLPTKEEASPELDLEIDQNLNHLKLMVNLWRWSYQLWWILLLWIGANYLQNEQDTMNMAKMMRDLCQQLDLWGQIGRLWFKKPMMTKVEPKLPVSWWELAFCAWLKE